MTHHGRPVSRLTTSHVEHDGTRVRLRLGQVPITLPTPAADLTLRLLDGKRGHATTGAGGASPWLFPGGQPGRPINASHLGQRLKALGIQPGHARSTALFQLAAEHDEAARRHRIRYDALARDDGDGQPADGPEEGR